jgi:hypothetical protein
MLSPQVQQHILNLRDEKIYHERRASEIGQMIDAELLKAGIQNLEIVLQPATVPEQSSEPAVPAPAANKVAGEISPGKERKKGK